MNTPTIRILKNGDETALESFLTPVVESSMFLISNLESTGFTDNGLRFEGTYAAAFNGKEIVGVVAHYWNQNLIFQAPSHIPELVQQVVKHSHRSIKGLVGPNDQVEVAKSFLNLASFQYQHDEMEKLFSLELRNLRVPTELSTGQINGRLASRNDLDLLVKWRLEYLRETLNESVKPEMIEPVRDSVESMIEDGKTWVIEKDHQLVSTSSFNSVVLGKGGVGLVQVGGVWTPPNLRNNKYGRAAVATSLVDAHKNGYSKAILFTGETNTPAQKAYSALGFEYIGNYRLTLLHEAISL